MKPFDKIATSKDRAGAAFGNLVFETWPLIIPLNQFVRYGDSHDAMLLACVLPIPAVVLAYFMRGSLGSFFAGLIVTNDDGGRVGLGRIILRCLPYVVYSINGIALKAFEMPEAFVLFLGGGEFLILGFVCASAMPLFLRDDRTLLDRITRTRVQKKYRV